jgi:hypothetical protein
MPPADLASQRSIHGVGSPFTASEPVTEAVVAWANGWRLMTQLSRISNVFGFLHSPIGLQPVAAALCSQLGLTPDQVWIKRSSFDGIETLLIETETCVIESLPTETSGTWLFNGAVEGSSDEVFEILLPIVQKLDGAGFSATFEIYDAAFRLLGKCPR